MTALAGSVQLSGKIALAVIVLRLSDRLQWTFAPPRLAAMSQMGMEHEQQYIDQGAPGGYHDNNGHWIESQHAFHNPQHSSPAQEFSAFHFTPMPMEPIHHSMPPPRCRSEC